MKKLFKKLKDSKLFNNVVAPVALGIAGFIPGARPLLDIGSNAVSKLWVDKNEDGKIQLNEIAWPQIAIFFGIVVSLKFGLVDRETIEWIVNLALDVLATSN